MIKAFFSAVAVLVGGFLLVTVFFLLFVFPFTGLHYVTGDGEHVGIVTAVERHGLVFKTWTAYVKTDAQSSQEDRYCVVDEQVVERLKNAATDGRKVKLGYMSWFSAGVTDCSGEGDVISSVNLI